MSQDRPAGDGLLLRYMTRGDVPAVARIDRIAYKTGCTRGEFAAVLDTLDMGAVVIEVDGVLAGFIVWHETGHVLRIRRLAVLPEYRRRRAGSMLVAQCIGHLGRERPSRAQAIVDEHALEAQAFFRSRGWRAVNVLRRVMADRSDGYVFSFRPQIHPHRQRQGAHHV